MEHNVTLKQLATVLGVPMERIRTVARKPITGQPYDPKAINWDAIDAFVSNRLARTDFDSVEEVYAAAEEVVTSTGRALGGSAAPKKMLKAIDAAGFDEDGKAILCEIATTPERKGNLSVGDLITEKKTGVECEVVYVDETIVVYRAIAEHDADTCVLTHSIGNRNFNSKFVIGKYVPAPAAEAEEADTEDAE